LRNDLLTDIRVVLSFDTHVIKTYAG
jgi:hypothetical protein